MARFRIFPPFNDISSGVFWHDRSGHTFLLLLRPLPSSAGPISRLNIRLSPKRFTLRLSSGTFWWILVSRRKPVCPYGNVVGYSNNFFWKSRRTQKTPKLTWSHTGWSPRHTPAVFPTSSGPWQSSFSLRILVSKLIFSFFKFLDRYDVSSYQCSSFQDFHRFTLILLPLEGHRLGRKKESMSVWRFFAIPPGSNGAPLMSKSIVIPTVSAPGTQPLSGFAHASRIHPLKHSMPSPTYLERNTPISMSVPCRYPHS